MQATPIVGSLTSSLHPHRVRGLVELEGPVHFGGGKIEAALARAPRTLALTRPRGNVPGSFLDWTSVCVDPVSFQLEPWLDWVQSLASSASHHLHWRMRRWSLDERPMAQRLFEEVVRDLYQENQFAEGQLQVSGRTASLRAIEAPLLAVLDPRSRIVPPSSIQAYRTHTGSTEVQIIEYCGDSGVMIQHLGVLIGRVAHTVLWPQITNWIRRLAIST